LTYEIKLTLAFEQPNFDKEFGW